MISGVEAFVRSHIQCKRIVYKPLAKPVHTVHVHVHMALFTYLGLYTVVILIKDSFTVPLFGVQVKTPTLIEVILHKKEPSSWEGYIRQNMLNGDAY